MAPKPWVYGGTKNLAEVGVMVMDSLYDMR
jgi:hypothetical protein